ncbi:MAG: UDP-N-acetylglucosamine diphosphorylase [Verrucomicrobiota bacterium]
MSTFAPEALLDFDQTEHAAIFDGCEHVWEVLPKIKTYLADQLANIGELQQGDVHERAVVGDQVYVAPGATIEANAVIKGPAWIGAGTTVRSGAYIRENVIIGEGCTIGNSSEFKNCLLFNGCEVPHFNYVGDSVLGYKAHLGAGVICSNVRLDRQNVKIRDGEGNKIETGLRKFGAMVGDLAEVGCNSVLSPGTVIGRESIIYPCTNFVGVLGEKKIAINRPQIVERDRG